LAEYTLFRCDRCAREQSVPPGALAPDGWLLLQQQDGSQAFHFCSYACLLMFGHDKTDYSNVPKPERLRTALQSLGFLPRIGAQEVTPPQESHPK
jgi:hypothetical protein